MFITGKVYPFGHECLTPEEVKLSALVPKCCSLLINSKESSTCAYLRVNELFRFMMFRFISQ